MPRFLTGGLPFVQLLCSVGWLLISLAAPANARVTLPTPGDRPGGDFLSFGLPADVPDLCRIACQRHARCRAYTYGPPVAAGSNARCWLKETTPVLVSTAPFQSGVRIGRSTAADPLVNHQPEDFKYDDAGFDRFGGDYASVTLPPLSLPTACAALCRRDASCLAFTFTEQDGRKTCHLKDSVPAGRDCRAGVSCSSGRKIGNPEVALSNVAFANNIQKSVDPVRPLLVVVFNAPATAATCPVGQVAPVRTAAYHAGQTTAYWRRLFFGANEPSVSGYFYRASGGKFSFVEAGTLGPVNIGCIPAQGVRLFALQQAVRTGFDFARFDRNGDGTVSADELSVIVIDNITVSAAQTLPSIVGPVSGVAINPAVTAIGYQSQFSNFAHELAHHFELFDAYGALGLPSQCFGTNVTLAGCTAGAAGGGAARSQQFVSVYPDGYHRMRWGWTQPLVVSMKGGRGGCYRLTSVPHRHNHPIIFYDPDRADLGAASSEYYLVEHRDSSLNEFGDASGARIQFRDLAGNPFGTAWSYDNDFISPLTANAGALVWWIQVAPAGASAGVWNRSIRITRGLNNTLDSVTAAADADLPDGAGQRFAILPGANGLIESTRVPDDVEHKDSPPISTITPRATLPAAVFPTPFRFAPAPVLLANSSPTPLAWFDGTPAPMTIRAGPVRNLGPGDPSTVELEWGSVPLAIEMLSRSFRVEAGSTLRLRGLFGASNFAGARRLVLEDRPTRPLAEGTPLTSSIALTPRSWSCGEIQVDVPRGVKPGSYVLRVIGIGDEPEDAVNVIVAE